MSQKCCVPGCVESGGLHQIPHFTVSGLRNMRNIIDKPSTSLGTVSLFGPEFNMSHHLMQENIPTMSSVVPAINADNMENKENIPIAKADTEIDVIPTALGNMSYASGLLLQCYCLVKPVLRG
ncbi:hypothetical protein ACJJTC_009591 [Scirpophaga incertulas]